MWREALRAQAEVQHGLIGLDSLSGCGATVDQLRHELAGPSWERIGRGVWRLIGSQPTSLQQAFAGVLAAGPGAALSHQSAAWLWGLPGYQAAPTHVVRLRASNSASPEATVVHRMRALPGDQVTLLDQIAIVRPELLLVQLAGLFRHRPKRLERNLDHLWSRRLLSGASLRATIDRMAKRGRPGIPVLRQLLDDRGEHWVPPASGLESRVMYLLDEHGLHGFERQVDLGSTLWAGRVDFVHRASRTVIEVQSERHHAALSYRQDDVQRIQRLEEAGFVVVEVWDREVWHHPEAWLPRVATAMHRPH